MLSISETLKRTFLQLIAEEFSGTASIHIYNYKKVT
jgi:hypothetical protein